MISTSMPANINRFISSPDFGLWAGPDLTTVRGCRRVVAIGQKEKSGMKPFLIVALRHRSLHWRTWRRRRNVGPVAIIRPVAHASSTARVPARPYETSVAPHLFRLGLEPPHEPVAAPNLNVMAIKQSLGSLDRLPVGIANNRLEADEMTAGPDGKSP
jgi:hypothetical protein